MNSISIRALAPADLSRVGTLVEVNGMFPPDMLPDMTAPFFSGDPAHRWIVCESDGRVVGAAYSVREQLTDGTWNVLMICVDPLSHGKGLGAAMMRHIESGLGEEGARVLLVETSGTAEFERTRCFYDMLGYEREARIRDYYAAGDDKVIFRKALT